NCAILGLAFGKAVGAFKWRACCRLSLRGGSEYVGLALFHKRGALDAIGGHLLIGGPHGREITPAFRFRKHAIPVAVGGVESLLAFGVAGCERRQRQAHEARQAQSGKNWFLHRSEEHTSELQSREN